MAMKIWGSSLSSTIARTFTHRHSLIVSQFINQSLKLCVIILHRQLPLNKIGWFPLKLKNSKAIFLRKPVAKIKPNCSSIVSIHNARSNVWWDWIDNPTKHYQVTPSPQNELWWFWTWFWYGAINKTSLVPRSECDDHWSRPWKVIPTSNQFLRNKLNSIVITTTEVEWIYRVTIRSCGSLIVWGLIILSFFSGCHWWSFEPWRRLDEFSKNPNKINQKTENKLIWS